MKFMVQPLWKSWKLQISSSFGGSGGFEQVVDLGNTLDQQAGSPFGGSGGFGQEVDLSNMFDSFFCGGVGGGGRGGLGGTRGFCFKFQAPE